MKKDASVSVAILAVLLLMYAWRMPMSQRKRPLPMRWIVAPALAGVLSLLVLRSYDIPIKPFDEALAYAKSQAHRYAPGEVVPDLIQPPMINFMISQAEFDRTMDLESLSWFNGVDPAKGAALVMVPSNMVSADCVGADLSSAYAIVKPACAMRDQINKRRGYGS